jgi:hypothetical protein
MKTDISLACKLYCGLEVRATPSAALRGEDVKMEWPYRVDNVHKIVDIAGFLDNLPYDSLPKCGHPFAEIRYFYGAILP